MEEEKEEKKSVYYFLDQEEIRILKIEMRYINNNYLIKFKIR